jgi:hypothetical protein
MFKFTDFRAKYILRIASIDELPVGTERSPPYFLECIRKFKEQILASDTIYFYNSHKSDWDRGRGYAGFALVRDDELVDTLQIRMN